MKVAISNIAWALDHDLVMAELLTKLGVQGIEIAPPKVWATLPQPEVRSIESYVDFWSKYSLNIVAFQSLLFGRPDLKLFETQSIRNRTKDYLVGLVNLAKRVGATSLVFGSPQNRFISDSAADATVIATSFFRAIGQVALESGVSFCIEPNPREYGCNFINTAVEGLSLVEKVNNDGFGLHLDLGALIVNNEDPLETIPNCIHRLRHFHVSEPNLAWVGKYPEFHRRAAKALKEFGYNGWVSIEMRASGTFELEQFERVLYFVLDVYGD